MIDEECKCDNLALICQETGCISYAETKKETSGENGLDEVYVCIDCYETNEEDRMWEHFHTEKYRCEDCGLTVKESRQIQRKFFNGSEASD